ncbi:hypothetical protein SAMN04487968_11419 [Nocardioides terrae]|uniref:Uncharacterized protein n=1 Tax=Nocardioides terrae TaxID=574651 RepID=A0A1I1N7U4_9ACTN|nr:hypothetical protein [Nocardioides terrae]SFC90853.1 hypothetical protein SAMN04487968_11419 [Nocardioides terrae]
MPETPDEELVRRLLADARHDEPMPADVAARLDSVLGDLAADGPRPAEVTPLRRPDRTGRRRWAVALVAAAAAVVAIAVAPRISMSPSGGESSDSTAADSAGGTSSGSAAGKSLGAAVLHRDTLAADVRAARRRLSASLHALQSQGPTELASGCAPADWGPGSPAPALLDGQDVVLVLRPPAGDRQVVDVLECGTARQLASVTLPAP